MSNTTAEVVTQPYKWVRTFYAGLAAAAGCTHEFKVVPLPEKFPDRRNKAGNAYTQFVTGPDKAVSRVERAAERVLAEIEVVVRAENPGPHMYTRNAAKMREDLAGKIDFAAEIRKTP